jgi:hypothetical protein
MQVWQGRVLPINLGFSFAASAKPAPYVREWDSQSWVLLNP